MLSYINGLNNHIESEAIQGALVRGRNSPQKVPYGLYAEQLSGSAFTMKREKNLHSWLYKLRPSVLHGDFSSITHPLLKGTPFHSLNTPPMQMRWSPMPYPTQPTNFIDGLVTFAGNGAIEEQMGAAIHLYAINASMEKVFFYNADGDFLIVPEKGELRFKTEFGILDVGPGEILVIQRGIKFQVVLKNSHARGYVCENFGAPFSLPELGTIGANGLAHPRDFQMPVAAFEEKEDHFCLLTKFQGQLWQADIRYSPLDVVAWHGTYVPYKYNLHLFNVINSVSFDHPDPSIFTVLTSPSAMSGIANIDFVIFPSRWQVAEETFRPPYYHRNIMSEFMGLIAGVYDAKETGFLPGGASIHNCMSPHGPDTFAYIRATNQSLAPEYYANTLAFMFESSRVWHLTSYAYEANFRQKDYTNCWQGLNTNFQSSLTA